MCLSDVSVSTSYSLGIVTGSIAGVLVLREQRCALRPPVCCKNPQGKHCCASEQQPILTSADKWAATRNSRRQLIEDRAPGRLNYLVKRANNSHRPSPSRCYFTLGSNRHADSLSPQRLPRDTDSPAEPIHFSSINVYCFPGQQRARQQRVQLHRLWLLTDNTSLAAKESGVSFCFPKLVV